MTYPLASLGVQITPVGITAPTYEDVLESLKASMRQIFGVDIYIEPDSQDGQMIAVFAQAIHDCNQAAIAAYHSFSPNSAQGIGLSNVVKINHIQRRVPTRSTVLLKLVGQEGTIVQDGIAGDANGNRWALPSSVVIPGAGFINITATCTQDGAVSAPVGSVTQIITPTLGWQSVTNEVEAAAGQPVETDADLRRRQVISPALNSYSTMSGLVAALQDLDGVTYLKVYENDTNATDVNGVPAHSIAVVLEGGDSTEIATTILKKKGLGVGTHGTTTVNLTDLAGISRPIKYSVVTHKNVKVQVSLEALDGYTTLIADAIKESVAEYITALPVGADVLRVRLFVPAQLAGQDPESTYFEVGQIELAFIPAAFGTADLVVAYNEKAYCSASDVTIVLL